MKIVDKDLFEAYPLDAIREYLAAHPTALFQKGTGRAIRLDEICGFPVVASITVPEDEVRLIGENGQVVCRFKWDE